MLCCRQHVMTATTAQGSLQGAVAAAPTVAAMPRPVSRTSPIQTDLTCQAVAIVGTAPWLMAST